nr:hypothetical protein [Flavobacterium sp. ASV13]
MKKTILFLILSILLFSCRPTSTFFTATFLNKNVYKTKGNLPMKKVFTQGALVTDSRTYTIVPNALQTITKTTTTVTEGPLKNKDNRGNDSSYVKTVRVVSTIPKSSTATTKDSVSIEKKSTAVVVTSTTEYSEEIVDATKFWIRYKILSEDGSYTYIKVLPGCKFDDVRDTLIVYVDKNEQLTKEKEEEKQAKIDGTEQSHKRVSDYVFQVDNKNLVPNTHFLASSALVGKVITLPMRVRKEYWDDNKTTVEGTLALAYGFGWKYKLGQNPYRSWYLSTILYGAGISGQKHFFLTGTDPVTNKVLLSEKRDEIAITYLSFGAAIEYEKFSLGLFAGRDKMFGNSSNWAYQCKWWWGVGIGYDLFK